VSSFERLTGVVPGLAEAMASPEIGNERPAVPSNIRCPILEADPAIRIAAAVIMAVIICLALGACAHARSPRRIVPLPDDVTRAADDARVADMMRAVPVAAFEAATFTAPDDTIVPYRLLRPAEIAPGVTYPMVVVFHSSGAIGTDNVSQVGMLAKSWATPTMRSRYPAFVVVPQFATRSAEYRDIGTPAASSTATASLHAGLALIAELVTTLPVDRQRVYAAGFSMGGSAVWHALALRPGLFSAGVAVSGVPPANALIPPATPLLLIHGDADQENPFRAALRAYEQSRGASIELWQYRGRGHEFPAELLAGTAVADWLFGATRR
jgi:poly(3-hydroxybutyrate) depolymerase